MNNQTIKAHCDQLAAQRRQPVKAFEEAWKADPITPAQREEMQRNVMAANAEMQRRMYQQREERREDLRRQAAGKVKRIPIKGSCR